jgi:hypothetical protein
MEGSGPLRLSDMDVLASVVIYPTLDRASFCCNRYLFVVLWHQNRGEGNLGGRRQIDRDVSYVAFCRSLRWTGLGGPPWFAQKGRKKTYSIKP